MAQRKMHWYRKISPSTYSEGWSECGLCYLQVPLTKDKRAVTCMKCLRAGWKNPYRHPKGRKAA